MNSEKQIMGIRGEQYSHAMLKKMFSIHDDNKVNHVDWKNYSWGYGLDLTVYCVDMPYIGIEVKNFNELQIGKYGLDWVKSDVFPRFCDEKHNYPIKILIVTFKKDITKSALALLEANNIKVFELGFLVTEDILRRQGQNGKLFYTILSKLQKFIKSVEPSFFGLGFKGFIESNNMLDYYFSDNTTSNNTINNELNTPIINDSSKVLVNWCFDRARDYFNQKDCIG